MWQHKTFSSENEEATMTHEEVRDVVCAFLTEEKLSLDEVKINEWIVQGILIISIYWTTNKISRRPA